MTRNQKVLWAVGGFVILLLVSAVSIPNLHRSRTAANRAAFVGKLRHGQGSQDSANNAAQVGLVAGVPERKLIRNAELGLEVANVRAAAEEIQRLTEAAHGEVDKLELSDDGDGFTSKTISVRVPAVGLEDALARFKSVASRVAHEQVNTQDVTREFYDNEAHMRNLRAEEEQYLAIMKQARTVKDTLEVSEKLSNVRDRIERLQTQIQVMSHDIEMSVVTIAIMQDSTSRAFSGSWRPLHSAKVGSRELIVGLGNWVDWVVAVVIKLPLIILWIVTIVGIGLLVWMVGRKVWARVNSK